MKATTNEMRMKDRGLGKKLVKRGINSPSVINSSSFDFNHTGA